MNLILILAGLALVTLPGATTSAGARLAPHEWARLTVASIWTGLVAIRLGLLVTAAPTALRLAGIHHLAHACHHTLGPITPGGTITGLAGGAALVVLQARIVHSRHRCRTTRATLQVEPWLGQHHHRGDHDLVIIPTASQVAYALDGQPPQVVLSQGLTQALTADELAAVIRHEQCHLQHGHQHYLELALVADAALTPLPLVRRSTAALRLAVERWADEAAAHHASRATVRSALTKVVHSMLTPVAAFTAAETIAARLDALTTHHTTPPTRWRLAAAAPAAALAATAGLALLTHSSHVHHGIFGLFGSCCLF